MSSKVVASYKGGRVKIVKFAEQGGRGWGFDVKVSGEVMATTNTLYSARWCASRYAPEARPV